MTDYAINLKPGETAQITLPSGEVQFITAPEPEYQIGAAYWITWCDVPRVMFRAKGGWALNPQARALVLDSMDFSIGDRVLVAPWPNDKVRANFLSTFTPGRTWPIADDAWFQSIVDAIREQGGDQ
jgi:hypothetical protein